MEENNNDCQFKLSDIIDEIDADGAEVLDIRTIKHIYLTSTVVI